MQYFEDLHVGMKASFGRYEVDRDEVIAFAGKYDPQPFHLSDEAASQTHFGRLSASGWQTTAISMSMLVQHMKDVGHAGLGGAGIDELRWMTPVYPGDVLRCETEILEVRASRSRPEMGSFRSRMTVFNHNDKPVMSYVSIGLIRRRPAGEET